MKQLVNPRVLAKWRAKVVRIHSLIAYWECGTNGGRRPFLSLIAYRDNSTNR